MRPGRSAPRARFARIFLALGALAVSLQSLAAAIHARSHSHAPQVTLASVAHSQTDPRDSHAHACADHHHHESHGDLGPRPGASTPDHTHPPIPPAPQDHDDCPVCAKLISASRSIITPDAACTLASAPSTRSADTPRELVQHVSHPRPRSSRGPPLTT